MPTPTNPTPGRPKTSTHWTTPASLPYYLSLGYRLNGKRKRVAFNQTLIGITNTPEDPTHEP